MAVSGSYSASTPSERLHCCFYPGSGICPNLAPCIHANDQQAEKHANSPTSNQSIKIYIVVMGDRSMTVAYA